MSSASILALTRFFGLTTRSATFVSFVFLINWGLRKLHLLIDLNDDVNFVAILNLKFNFFVYLLSFHRETSVKCIGAFTMVVKWL